MRICKLNYTRIVRTLDWVLHKLLLIRLCRLLLITNANAVTTMLFEYRYFFI